MSRRAINGRRLPDFVKFGRRLVASGDIDPLYPILSWIETGMDAERALWHSLLYVAWYNLPSGVAAFHMLPAPDATVANVDLSKWATGTERRNNRGGRVRDHLVDYVKWIEQAGGIEGFLAAENELGAFDEEARRSAKLHHNWRIVNDNLQRVHGNGRWAAYKHCEILRRVEGWPMMAPDMGHQFSSGPREGLEHFYGALEGQGPDIIHELDIRGVELQIACADEGLDVDIEELETILCNWKSLLKGKYYVGHDIDENQEQIIRATQDRTITRNQANMLWTARKESLPHQYLGELNGWVGVDKQRMKAYASSSKILVRKAA